LICIFLDIVQELDTAFRNRRMMNASLVKTRSEARHPARCDRRLNDLLDQQVVPYAVNEAMIAAFREKLCRDGRPHTDGYWLLMARLAELALLCAGHYADCGEIGAAGDLLLNPRRIDIHLRGADRPIVKERHRRLSEQFNPGGLSFPAFTHWFQRNAITNLVEPALLPDFADHLRHSGRLAASFLASFQEGMSRVADTMRFASTGSVSHVTAEGQSHQCRFEATVYHRLGREVARTCQAPSYRSPFLVKRRVRVGAAAATRKAAPAFTAGQLSLRAAKRKDDPQHVDRTLFAG
jgi:hypothetical protein